jgi:hypothetical protein
MSASVAEKLTPVIPTEKIKMKEKVGYFDYNDRNSSTLCHT